MKGTPRAAKQQGQAADELIKGLQDAQSTTPVDDAAAQEAPESHVQPPTGNDGGELAALRAENERLKQSYDTLKGKYNAEIPRLTTQVKELSAVIETLRSEKAQTAPDFNLDTEAIATEYGDDVAAIAKAAETANQKVMQMQAVEDARIEAATASAVEMAQATFYERVNELIPNFWEEKDNDPEWKAFLNTYTTSGDTWRDKAMREVNSQNPEGVAAIYQLFEDSKAQKTEATQPATKPVDPREALIPPKTTGHGAEDGKKVWTSAEIRALYEAKDKLARNQKSQFTPQQLEEQERDLFAAQSDGSGRYRPDL